MSVCRALLYLLFCIQDIHMYVLCYLSYLSLQRVLSCLLYVVIVIVLTMHFD